MFLLLPWQAWQNKYRVQKELQETVLSNKELEDAIASQFMDSKQMLKCSLI